MYNGGAHAKFANYAFDRDEFERILKSATNYVKKHPEFIGLKVSERHENVESKNCEPLHEEL